VSDAATDINGRRPTIALLVGDVAGIGPELVLKALASRSTYSLCRPVVIGDAAVLADSMRLLDSPLRVAIVDDIAQVSGEYGTVDVLAPDWEGFRSIPRGEVDAAAGRFAGVCLERAIDLAADGLVDGIAWAPINKQAFNLGGYHYRDEIEFLADRTQSTDARLFGVVDQLWVTPVTLHIPFRDVADMITLESVLDSITALDRVLRHLGRPEPAIAVAALNPHAGDGGLLGMEEIEHIAPAVADARAHGVRAHGPFPADTVFPRAAAERYDGIVCMHHDQANIARKLHPFPGAATVVTGLPVPVGTTAHGTAYDRVGTGTADPGSLLTAMGQVAGLAGAATPVPGSGMLMPGRA
jgi:4-hydroxythreonine-4-phosphate dehydrogenase